MLRPLFVLMIMAVAVLSGYAGPVEDFASAKGIAPAASAVVITDL